MEPRIIKKGAFIVAGVTGSGDETSKIWEAFMKIQRVQPLKNQVGEVGYEIRMYPGGEGSGEVHVGVQVNNARVPAEYKVVSLPASMYAEFEIYPAKGYSSSNTAMNKWLSDNADIYKEVLMDGRQFVIEVYDKRFKGNDNLTSVVGCLVPIIKT